MTVEIESVSVTTVVPARGTIVDHASEMTPAIVTGAIGPVSMTAGMAVDLGQIASMSLTATYLVVEETTRPLTRRLEIEVEVGTGTGIVAEMTATREGV
jgi:hypothetical protein